MVRLVSAFVAVCVVLCTAACAGEQVVADKLAVPEERQQDESLKLIKSVFEKEYRTAKTGKQKRALAEKMLDVSAETNSDMAAKFVLLRVARDIALEIGDLEIAENTVTELDNHFDIDVLEIKCSTYDSLAKSLTDRASIGKYANSLKRLISDLIADDRFDEALKVCDLSEIAARKLRNTKITEETDARKKQIESLMKKFAAAKPSMKDLKSDPSDPEANFEVGKYKCFAKGEWVEGLQMLELGSDAELKTLAQLDLSDDAKQKALELGDAWWAVAQQLEGYESEQVKLRAANWYREALDDLSGLHKLRVQKRIEQIGALAEIEGIGTRPTPGVTRSKAGDKKGLASDAALVMTFEPATISRQNDRMMVQDVSGNNHHATVTEIRTARGKAGESVSFDESTPPLVIQTPGLIPRSGDFSVFVWLRTRQRTGQANFLTNNKGQKGRADLLIKDGVLRWFQSQVGEHDSGKFVADGIWHHVGISRQGTAFTVWVDGKAIPVANASASIDEHRWQLGRTISKGHHGRFVFIGQLDELHVYHRALSDDEVRHVME